MGVADMEVVTMHKGSTTPEIYNLKSLSNQQPRNCSIMKAVRLALVAAGGLLHLLKRVIIVMDLGLVVALEAELASILDDLLRNIACQKEWVLKYE